MAREFDACGAYLQAPEALPSLQRLVTRIAAMTNSTTMQTMHLLPATGAGQKRGKKRESGGAPGSA